MVLDAVFEDELPALIAGRPLAHQAKEDVVCEVVAVFALAHVVVKLGEGLRDLYEEHFGVYQLGALYFDLGLLLDDGLEEPTGVFLLILIEAELLQERAVVSLQEECLHPQLEVPLDIL